MGEGPLAICVHGFPDSAYTWRHLLPELAAAGFRAVAPWTRGYFPTAVASDGFYEVGARARDMCRLHEALGGDGDAVIIGHDFGAGAARVAAVREPDRWSKVVSMSVPPGERMAKALMGYEQLRRSSYMFVFQQSFSERVVPNDDYAFIRGLWADWSPGFDGTQDIGHFIDAVQPDGHLVAALAITAHRSRPNIDRRNLPNGAQPVTRSPNNQCSTCTVATTAALERRPPRESWMTLLRVQTP